MTTNTLPNLIIYKFLFNLEALQNMLLPEFKGSTIRGTFGWEFYNTVGPLKPIFDYVFVSPAPSDVPDDLKGVENVPHPIIIHPPRFKKRSIKKGEVFNIGLTLIGNANNFIPFFVDTVKKMGERGLTEKGFHFRLINVLNISAGNSRNLVYENSTGILKTNFEKIITENIIRRIDYNRDKLTLNFTSPFLIQTENVEIKKEKYFYLITPKLIIENFERRARHLAWLYCNSKYEKAVYDTSNIKIDIRELKKFKTLRKRTNSDNHVIEKLYGLIGSITLEGNLKEVLPIINIGEKINFGKKTSFGFGEFFISG